MYPTAAVRGASRHETDDVNRPGLPLVLRRMMIEKSPAGPSAATTQIARSAQPISLMRTGRFSATDRLAASPINSGARPATA